LPRRAPAFCAVIAIIPANEGEAAEVPLIPYRAPQTPTR
jgi:hypothetical protein